MPDTPPALPNPVTPGPGVFPDHTKLPFQHRRSKAGCSASTVVPGGKAQAPSSSPNRTSRPLSSPAACCRAVRCRPSCPAAAADSRPLRYRAAGIAALLLPSEPVLLLEGAGRSFKHGSDGRFSQDNTLVCRLTGFVVTELSSTAVTGQPNRPSVHGQDVLDRGIENGSVPPECEDFCARPFCSIRARHRCWPRRRNARGQRPAGTATAQNFTVEQTVWWATRNPNFDHASAGGTADLPARSPRPSRYRRRSSRGIRYISTIESNTFPLPTA